MYTDNYTDNAPNLNVNKAVFWSILQCISYEDEFRRYLREQED